MQARQLSSTVKSNQFQSDSSIMPSKCHTCQSIFHMQSIPSPLALSLNCWYKTTLNINGQLYVENPFQKCTTNLWQLAPARTVTLLGTHITAEIQRITKYIHKTGRKTACYITETARFNLYTPTFGRMSQDPLQTPLLKIYKKPFIVCRLSKNNSS